VQRTRRKHSHCASFYESFVPRRVLRSSQDSHDVNGETSFNRIALFTHLYRNASMYRIGGKVEEGMSCEKRGMIRIGMVRMRRCDDNETGYGGRMRYIYDESTWLIVYLCISPLNQAGSFLRKPRSAFRGPPVFVRRGISPCLNVEIMQAK